MSGVVTRRWAPVAIAMMTMLPCLLCHAVTLKRTRIWAGPIRTRVVFDLSAPFRYTLKLHGNRAVIKMPVVSLGRHFEVPRAQGRLQKLTVTRRSDLLQLVVVMTPRSYLHYFSLDSSGVHGDRLVLDISAAKEDKVSTRKKTGISHRRIIKKLDLREAATLLGSERKVVVVIDPGHGGKDSGTHGRYGTLEKHVTLAVGRYLKAAINKQPGMKAVLTRNGDYFIPLRQRYAIARTHKADLFVSIHADSYPDSAVRGSSVWVLSSRGRSSVAARLLADHENSVDLIGGVSLRDENNDLASLLLDMQQGWAIRSSMVSAKEIIKALAKVEHIHRPHIEHANFVVLRSPDVPSILIETAFLSNPAEELKLRNPKYQQMLAKAVVRGIHHYFEHFPPLGTWFAAQVRHPHQVRLIKHRVVRGESLSVIAHRYRVSLRLLKSVNNLHDNHLRAGVSLKIPAG